MSYHTQASAVARADQIAAELLAATLGARPRSYGAPSVEGVSMLRRDLDRERSIPWKLLCRVKIADVIDGVPLERVLADVRILEAALRANARTQRPASLRPLTLLQQAETKHDARLDAAQMRLAYDQSPEALRELVEAARLHLEAVADLKAAAETLLFAPHLAATAA